MGVPVASLDSVDSAALDVHVARAAIEEVRARLDQYAPIVDGESVDVVLEHIENGRLPGASLESAPLLAIGDRSGIDVLDVVVRRPVVRRPLVGPQAASALAASVWITVIDWEPSAG